MKIHMYNNDGTKFVAEVYVRDTELPPIVYTFIGQYRYYIRGSARNSTTYYEAEALHVTEAVEETLTTNPTSAKM